MILFEKMFLVNSIMIIPGETQEVLVKSSEYFQLRKKLEKGIHETIIRTVNQKLCKCKVLGTGNNMKVLVTVLEEF